MHFDYIRQALDHCRRTDDYPDDARFRWVHEVSWPVTEFLRACPERSEELIARLQEGRMELCALYVHPTELFDLRSYREPIRPARDLSQRHGFPLTTAAIVDVPGQAWGLAELLAEQGIPYLRVSKTRWSASRLR